jgi:hypothetical protein
MTVTDWISVAAGLTSSGLWLWSALVVSPLLSTPMERLNSQMAKQSTLSAIAALFAALSVGAQAIGVYWAAIR